jgi:hypothetical protein
MAETVGYYASLEFDNDGDLVAIRFRNNPGEPYFSLLPNDPETGFARAAFELIDGKPCVVLLTDFGVDDDLLAGPYVIHPPSDWDRLSEDQRRDS